MKKIKLRELIQERMKQEIKKEDAKVEENAPKKTEDAPMRPRRKKKEEE